jgi:hypothetical protein
MKDSEMFEYLTDRAIAGKGVLGFITTTSGIIASLKAATVFFQCVAALCAAIAGVITVYVMLKNFQKRRSNGKPKISIRNFLT